MFQPKKKQRQTGLPSISLAKLKTKVNGWVTKEGFTAVDVLSVEQAKVCLHTLDTDLNGIIWTLLACSLMRVKSTEQRLSQISKRTESHIYLFGFKRLSSPSKHMIKRESKELVILQWRLTNLEMSVWKANVKIKPLVPVPDINRYLL